jgi:hypothetical protein
MVSRPGGATWSRAPLTRISGACLGGSETRTEATPASGPCRALSPAQGSVAAASATRLHAPPWTFARERGARALEGYPMIPERGKDVAWGELNVGHVSIFTAAGFAEASRPTLRRAVMRIDF